MDELLEFKKNAILGKVSGQPLCEEYKAAIRKCGNDKEMLVRLALKQQCIPYLSCACYNHLGLTKDYVKREFKDYINGYVFNDCDDVQGYTYALYVDWDYENDLDVKTDVASIMWTVGANIIVPQTKAPTIYISNKSKVHFVCEGFNSVRVYMFDKSELTIEDCDNDCSVTILKYSDKCKVERGKFCLSEKIKEFNKELKL